MANEFGLFFNSINNDRTYDADNFSEWLRKFFTTGVFSGDLAVTAGTGMRVTLGTGYCNIEGKVRFFDAPTTLTIAQANSSYPRIDTVVIECDYTNREITAKVVTGAYSGGSPQPTAPVRNDEVYQIVVAEVYVNVGATSITDAVITDKRFDTAVCGIVAGTVQEMDFSSFESQFHTWLGDFQASETSEFEAWFEEIKGQLDEDAAGHLQNEVDTLDGRIDTLEDLGLSSDGTTLTSAQKVDASAGIDVTGGTLAVTGGRDALVDENGHAIIAKSYSTTEHLTGEKWIDGKPIYRKVFQTTTSSTGNVDVGSIPSGLAEVVSFRGVLTTSSGVVVPIAAASPNAPDNNYDMSALLNPSTGKITVSIGNARSGSKTVTIILEYTKS